MEKKIRGMRKGVMDYSILADCKDGELDREKLPNNANIILFGPAGSGKSSLIK